MDRADGRQLALHTDAGELPLQEYRLRVAGRQWAVLHTHAMLTVADEAHFFRELRNRVPYGVALWPAAVALAHELAARAAELDGAALLELGAGTGLPGIVAASLGATVTQTDRHELALEVCRRNGARNGVQGLAYRQADWAAWDDSRRYGWIVGADILYAEEARPHLRRIFAANLAPGGRVLLADPLRQGVIPFLEELEADGWRVTLSTWSVGEAAAPRTIALFELLAPLD
jgi:predicted nicotinamide N-methyase